MKYSHVSLFLVVLLLLLVLGSGFVNAAVNVRGDVSCSLYTLNNYGSSDTDSLFSSIVNNEDGAALINSFKNVISNKKSTCFSYNMGVSGDDAYFSGKDYIGTFAGGYMYVTKPLVEQEIWRKASTDDSKHFCADYNLALYPITSEGITSIGNSLGSWLINEAGDPEMITSSDSGLCLTDSFWDWSDTGAEDVTATEPVNYISVKPGLYYVISVVHGHTDSNQKSSTGAYVKPFSFKPSVGTFSGLSSSLDQHSRGFTISNRFLYANELNTNFGIEVEKQQWLCNAAGGKMFNDSYLDIYNSMKTDEVLDDFDINHMCCGDDGNGETYSITYDHITYYCHDGDWEDGTPKEKCGALTDDNYDSGEFCYLDEANKKSDGSQYFYHEIEGDPTDGTDGCCGDDTTLPPSCVLAGLTCAADANPDDCSGSLYGCRSGDVCVKKPGVTIPSCEDQSENTCTNYPGCYKNIVPTCDDGYGGAAVAGGNNLVPTNKVTGLPTVLPPCATDGEGNPILTTRYDGCEGEFNCGSNSETTCKTTFSNYCQWNEKPCTGTPADVCKNKLDKSSCETPTSSYTNENVCVWDQVAIGADIGYVTDDSKYFCSKDLYMSSQGYLSLSYFDLDAAKNKWSWWDAVENNVPFKIHNIDNVDFISNAKQWYYCGGSGNEIPNSNAVMISEGESFALSSDSGSFRCVDTLNSLVDFFDSHAGEDGYDLDYFSEKGYFSTCQNSSDKSYCCVDGSKYAEDIYYDQGKFKEVCLDACYLDEPKRMANVWVRNSPELDSFIVEFCTRFPWDNLCQESLDGDWTFGLESPGTDLLLKSDCSFGMTGCFSPGIDVEGDCEAIQNYPFENYDYIKTDGTTSNKYEGIKCDYGSMEEGFKYCTTGLYANSGDTSQEDSTFCCLAPQGQYTKDTACVPVEGDMSPAICAAIDGDYYEDWENGADKAQCMTPIGSYEGCCVGGKWVFNWNQLAFEGLVQSESFICYQHGDEQRIAECCTEFSTCNNYNYKQDDIYSMFADSNRQDRTYFTSGGTIHNLENFDDWSENTDMLLLSDYVRVDTGIKASNSMNVDFTTVIRDNQDWSTFTYLEFDIAYNLPKKLNVVLISDDDSQKTCTYSLNDHLVNGHSSMRWHHAVIDISSSEGECSDDFDWSDVTSLELTTEYTGGMSIALDAIYLSEGGDNTDDYYCTGNFGSWIKNLDGPDGDRGFVDAENLAFEEYGPYWYACESQASFDWSGHLCCGDDTYIPYNKAQGQELGEYYYDSSMGCFGGNPVYENWRLGDTLNDPAFNGILYYNGEFHECIDDNSYLDYHVSYDGVTSEPNMPLITNTSTSYTIMGSYICSTNGDWVSLDEIPRSKIIASKLYDLTFEDGVQRDNYNLVCDSFDQASPYFNNSIIPKEELLYFTSMDTNELLVADFCTLSYRTNNGEMKILTGLSLKQPVGVFLRAMTNHLSALSNVAIDDAFEDEFANSCTNSSAGYSTNDDFFRVCNQPVAFDSLDLKMAYNPDFKILFMSYVNNENDFNELFEPGEGAIERFYENFVKAFTELFTKLFRSAKSGEEFVITTENHLPKVLNDSATYNHIYLSRDGAKQIQAFKTTYKYQGQDIETINVEYDNFNSNVELLALNYYNTRDYSINYMRGINKQIINIDKPVKLNSFEQDFDWRTLTTQLRTNSTNFGPKITGTNTPNDGIIDEGELCDRKPVTGELVFKYPRTDCYFWNSSYEENCGVVSCLPTRQIDFTDCETSCVREEVDDNLLSGSSDGECVSVCASATDDETCALDYGDYCFWKSTVSACSPLTGYSCADFTTSNDCNPDYCTWI